MARFRARYLLVLAGWPLLAGGCAEQLFPQAARPPVRPQKTVRANGNSPSSQAPGGQPPANDAARQWAQALGRWVRGEVPAKGGSGVPGSAPKKRVFVDVVALAQRHPCWQLAAALERGDDPAAALAGFQNTSFSLSAPPFPVIASRPGNGALTGASGRTGRGETGSPQVDGLRPVRIAANGLARREDIAQRLQDAAIDRFLEDTAELQKDERIDRAASLRAAIRDEAQAAARAMPDDLIPEIPADPVQLEMTNLRLQLLENSRLTVEEYEAAEKRLHELEAAWRARLKAQENQQRAALQRLRRERPAQIRRAGEAELDRTLAAAQEADDRLREEIRSAHATRVAVDFDADSRTLGIQLPGTPSSTPSQVGGASNLSGGRIAVIENGGVARGSGRNAGAKKLISIETFLPALPSTKRIGRREGAESALQAQTRIQIRALRLQALTEARRWAQTAARRGDWVLVSNSRPPGTGSSSPANPVLDGTGTALRLLGLAPGRTANRPAPAH